MIPHDPSRQQIDPRQLILREGPGALWDMLVAHGYDPQVDVFEDLMQCLLGNDPLLLEGVRGGGKTALVITLARACNLDQFGVSGRDGITAEELLYQWDKDEQREWMAEARAAGLDVAKAREKKWTREFLILGEFLAAYEAAAASIVPPLLFMDEIDKVGPKIEDMLLQPLANGVMYIPRLQPEGYVGTHDRGRWPIVLCASNNLRHKLSTPFRSRHIHSYIETPDNRKEVTILLHHVPDTTPYLLGAVVKWLDAVRCLGGLDDPPAIRESIRLLAALNRDRVGLLTEEIALRYQGLVVKSKEDRDYLKENMDYVVRFANAENEVFDEWVREAITERRLALGVADLEEEEVLAV
ncbi:MAG: AAA family ATPase [Pyrinomonadaceae bacterium]